MGAGAPTLQPIRLLVVERDARGTVDTGGLRLALQTGNVIDSLQVLEAGRLGRVAGEPSQPGEGREVHVGGLTTLCVSPLAHLQELLVEVQEHQLAALLTPLLLGELQDPAEASPVVLDDQVDQLLAELGRTGDDGRLQQLLGCGQQASGVPEVPENDCCDDLVGRIDRLHGNAHSPFLSSDSKLQLSSSPNCVVQPPCLWKSRFYWNECSSSHQEI